MGSKIFNAPRNNHVRQKNMIIILMGVSGCGKTTVGKILSDELGWGLYDGDDFHPLGNVRKMSRGVALNDEDRIPWLDALRQFIEGLARRDEKAVVTCSALKQSYRDRLARGRRNFRLVYLKGDFDLIQSRLRKRKRHFMKGNLLASQFAALEEPQNAIIADVSRHPAEVVAFIRQELE